MAPLPRPRPSNPFADALPPSGVAKLLAADRLRRTSPHDRKLVDKFHGQIGMEIADSVRKPMKAPASGRKGNKRYI